MTFRQAPSVAILFVTCNRLAYTRKSLRALLNGGSYPFSLHIVDNGSVDGSQDYLQRMRDLHPRIIASLTLNPENRGLAEPTNEFWASTDADLVGKVDNDTLVPHGWLSSLVRAHMKSYRLGVVGGFHFRPEDVDQAQLQDRLTVVDGVSLLPDVFIGGCCYLMKKRVQEKAGLIQARPGSKIMGWTEYQAEMAKLGYVNGYVHPLLFVDHMDDPRSTHCLAAGPYRDHTRQVWAERGVALQDLRMMDAWLREDARRVMRGDSMAEFYGQHAPA